MAAHFDFGGLSLERYYHFVCKTDRPTFELMDELGIADHMRRVKIRVFTGGNLHEWGDPIALLKSPGLGRRCSLDDLRDLIDWAPIERHLALVSCSAKGRTGVTVRRRPPCLRAERSRRV
jgi:protoporphyrinogen oxidase